jgi:alkylated DNA nucleotide flippase Atl1
MKPRYSFKEGSQFNQKSAQKVGETLSGMTKSSPLTAERVVGEAKREASPLHKFFEWNNQKAAKEYRLEQARRLMRSVVVVYESAKELPPVRAFITYVGDGEKEGYGITSVLLSDEEERARQVQRALKEANEWKQRWFHLKELANVFIAIEETKKKKGRKRKTT